MSPEAKTVSNELVRGPNTVLAEKIDPFIQDRIKRINDLATLINQAKPGQETVTIKMRGGNGKPIYGEVQVAALKRIRFGQMCYVADYLRDRGVPLREAIEATFKDNEPSVSQK